MAWQITGKPGLQPKVRRDEDGMIWDGDDKTKDEKVWKTRNIYHLPFIYHSFTIHLPFIYHALWLFFNVYL